MSFTLIPNLNPLPSGNYKLKFTLFSNVKATGYLLKCFGCHFLYDRSIFFCSNRPTIVFIIFLDFLMFHQIFLSPQVKRSAIISNKHGINELPHELLNDFRLGS